MTELVTVDGETLKSSGSAPKEFVVLRLRYRPEALFDKKQEQALQDEMLKRYQEQRKKAKDEASCIVEILPNKADSAVVRGLHALWNEVHEKEKGDVVVVKYPEPYIDILDASGLPDMAGFHLAYSTAEALRLLAGPKQAAAPVPAPPAASRKSWWPWRR